MNESLPFGHHSLAYWMTSTKLNLYFIPAIHTAYPGAAKHTPGQPPKRRLEQAPDPVSQASQHWPHRWQKFQNSLPNVDAGETTPSERLTKQQIL